MFETRYCLCQRQIPNKLCLCLIPVHMHVYKESATEILKGKRTIMVIYQVLLSFPLSNLTDFPHLKMRAQAFLPAILLPLHIIFLSRRSAPHPDMSLGQRQGHLSQVWGESTLSHSSQTRVFCVAKTEKGRSLRRQVDPLRIVGTEGPQRALGNSPNRTSIVLTSWLTLAFTQTLVER